MSRLNRIRLAFLSPCVLAPAFVSAVEPEPALEEVIVSARKRVENLQDIPDAVSVLTAADIESRGIVDLGDLNVSLSNFQLRESQQPGLAMIALRGVAMQRFQEPSVAVVVDGVQLTSPYQVLQSLHGIERIEVVRGPQGSLYGRNAIGGAINIVTQEPGDEFEGHASAMFAEGNAYGAELRLSAPVSEHFAYSLAGAYKDEDGLIDNEFLGTEADFETVEHIRGRLIYDAGSMFRADLRASWESREGGVGYFVNIPSGDVNDYVPVRSGSEGIGTRDLLDVSAKLDWDLGFATLTSISAYSEVDDDFFQDIDYEPPAFIDGLQFVTGDSVSQELRLTSAENQRLRWLAGAYFADIDQDIATNLLFSPCFFVDPTTCLLGPVDPASAIVVPFGINENNNRTYAVFGQIDYDLTDTLELTFGLRYDEDRRTQESLTENVTRRKTFDAFQPKASLAYHLNDTVMAYATVSRGFRSGGFNGTDYVERQYDAETLWNYELGMKSELLSRRVRVGAALFYMDYDDRQEYVLQPGTGSQTLFNVPESTITGFEIEATARLTRALSLQASVGYLETEIEESSPEFIAVFGDDYVGNSLPNVPEFSATLGLEHVASFGGDWELRSRIDYSMNEGLHWSIGNVADERDPLHLLGVRFTLRHDRFGITAFAENALDEEYYTEVAVPGFGSINPFPGGFPAEGRRLGMQLSVDF